MNHDNEFDQVLDDALAKCCDAEPLTGMEHRVLQRVRLQAERGRKVCRRRGAFATCAAMLALVLWIAVRNQARHQIIPQRPATAQQQGSPIELQQKNGTTHVADQEPAAARAMVVEAKHLRSLNVAGQSLLARTEHTPIRPQFPLAAPLNSEERALLAMAQTHPEVLSQLASNQDDQGIAIAPINIQPLTNETSGNRGEN